MSNSAMRYIEKQKLKVLMMMFFGTGMIGISMGLMLNHFMFVTMGTVNFCLGGFFGWIFLTQKPRLKDKRKRTDDKK